MNDRRRRNSTARFGLVLAVAALAGAACSDSEPSGATGAEPRATPRPPNIVLIIGDDHDYRDFGFMGSEIAHTPTLDSLARAGTVFTTAYSTGSACRPALRTLLTGLHHLAYEQYEQAVVRSGAATRDAGEVVSTLDTLPRRLADVGYRSFQSGKHWEGNYADAGFSDGMISDPGWSGPMQGFGLVRKTFQPVVDFLDGAGADPFLLWFAPMLPHVPHDAPDRFLAQIDSKLAPESRRYHANIAWFDSAVATLMEHLKTRGQLENSLIVYVADNGWLPAAGGERAQLGGVRGKSSLYEPGFRTPLIIHWPGRVPVAVRDDLVSTEDLFPTLLGYAGADVPAGRVGIDLRATLERGEPIARDALFGSMPPSPRVPAGGYFARTQHWRYLRFTRAEGDREELYDITADPLEQKNLATEHAARVARMRKQVAVWARETQESGQRLAEGPSGVDP